MTSEVCDGLMFTALQTSLSTAVGVSLAFPILSQIIESKSLKIIQDCKRILAKNKIKSDRFAFLDMGKALNGYQFFAERLSKFNEFLMISCALIGVFSFSLIILSTLYPDYCFPFWACLMVLAIISTPFVFGIFYLLYWFDEVKGVRGLLYFYDHDF